MIRSLYAARLALCPVIVIGFFGIGFMLSNENDPDAQARRVFRQNLVAASTKWSSVELECPSPGCANDVKATWRESGVKYIFDGFRHPKSIGAGGVVTLYKAKGFLDNSSTSLVTWVFRADDGPITVEVAEGAEATLSWADARASEFFYAIPLNTKSGDLITLPPSSK
jgi:hypothetical protein